MRLLQKYPGLLGEIMAKDAAIVDVSEVASWYFNELDNSKLLLTKDLDRLTPPSQKTYMEFLFPSIPDEPYLSNTHVGCFVSCAEIEEDERPFALHSYMLEREMIDATWEYKDETRKTAELKRLIEQQGPWPLTQEELTDRTLWPRFKLFVTLIADAPDYDFREDGSYPCALGYLGTYLAEDGRFGWRVNSDDSRMLAYPGSFFYISDSIPNKSETLDVILEYLAFTFMPFGFALSLVNCKNVHLVDDQLRQPRQMRRKQARKKTPPVVYKWLSVGSMKKQVDQDYAASGNRRQTRLHMVRSHWATYTADAPLFGKYTGTFFKPSFVKGSAKVGQVVKGYSVTSGAKPPQR